MIGMGIDIIDLAGFQEQLRDTASSFIKESFTESEIYDATHRPGRRPAQHFAARYAAKEALIKAWSGAIWGQPPPLSHVDMREIEVQCDRFGRPTLRLHGKVADAIDALGPLHIHLSLSHDGGYAAAVVVLTQRSGLSS